jgi:hypothetical protein
MDKIDRFIESVSPNQIKSKKWLAKEIESYYLEWVLNAQQQEINIELIGGWFGFPLLQYLNHLPINSVRNVDKDEFSIKVFQKYTELFEPEFDCVSVCKDIESLREENAGRQVKWVINTSCEHMLPVKELLKNRGYITEKVVFFLQSNNMFDEPDHINCVNSKDELIEQAGLKKVYYSGSMEFDTYKRFMVIGKWK